MTELEERLEREVAEWRAREQARSEKDARKSRWNIVLAALLGSTLLGAVVTEIGEIVGGEYREDVERCRIALDNLQDLGAQDLSGLGEEVQKRVLAELVEMMDDNCHFDSGQ
ncbi:hypothetical protein [Pseudoponticoccus marisrubri]|uniref:Uncharacterized protein n=1 Tax=Pseudoponticoccus marisrubri TaxID=1685382 RepID=A0A0W7WQ22_9RHOB|nr:hypothetical protein [Pseudoponticoccus marisrubri]KUF12683.1 hypothetical protein AVJ23_02905 [Pseudoponticoccus marisrubri]